jgi:outer membrane protein OmpA-like peptidoglycan-associated protein/uncharacterized surface protein with fasciclin (FAS1) repeats
MGAARSNQLTTGRYRRRVLGWGAAALLVIFAAGSVVTLDRVEDDLQERVTRDLEDAGFAGVSVSFSGQDGTVECAARLDDPDAASDVGAAVRGVQTLELAASCTTAGRLPPDEQSGPPPTATTSVPATGVETTSTSTSTTTTLPDPATVLDILLDDPQFSVLKNALEAVDLGGQFGGAGPITVFAPTDDAFAALGPNFNAALASDPEALEIVLRHHIVAQDLPSADLVDGPLVMLDETAVEIDTSSGLRVESGEVTAIVVDADLEAVNGTVHVIDQVLVPPDLDLGVVADVFTFVARYEGGRMTLSGSVATDGQRVDTVAAARRLLADANVVDQLVVDAEAPITDADVDALVELIFLIGRDLVIGEVVVAQDGIFVSGVFVDSTSIEGAAEESGASIALTQRPEATDRGAADLEEALNAAVTADPIRFEPASADLTADRAVLDRVASLAKSLGGLVITVEGHTDSDGAVLANVALSQARAEAVVDALVERGVPRVDVVAVGLGSAEPVLVDGVEDKAASRRVEFIVGLE